MTPVETLEAAILKLETERDEAQALIGDLRAILSRPGRKLELAHEKLAAYRGDLDLRERRLRARGVHDSHAGIVKTFRGIQ
jgi:hypothetical protein